MSFETPLSLAPPEPCSGVRPGSHPQPGRPGGGKVDTASSQSSALPPAPLKPPGPRAPGPVARAFLVRPASDDRCSTSFPGPSWRAPPVALPPLALPEALTHSKAQSPGWWSARRLRPRVVAQIPCVRPHLFSLVSVSAWPFVPMAVNIVNAIFAPHHTLQVSL